MSDKKTSKRMVTTSIRITDETHERLKTISDVWNTTMSEAIDRLIQQHEPAIEGEFQRRKETKKVLEKRPTRETDD